MARFRATAFACLATAISAGVSAEVIDGPVLQMDPNGVTPLAAEVRFSTDVPARASIDVTGPGGSWSVDFEGYSTEHALPILGMKPNGAYTVSVTTTDEGTGDEVVLEPALQATTGLLPEDFPVIELLVSQPEAMEPGYTLLDKFRRAGGEAGGVYTIILDNVGEVVWYSTIGSGATLQLANGNLFFREGDTAREIDMLGNDISVTLLEGNHLLHHDLFRTGDGTYLSLGHASVIVEGYPTSETDPDAPTQTATIDDNPVVEFNADGTVRNYWSFTSLLDPTRIGYGSVVQEKDTGLDWAHSNAVIHNPNTDTIVTSVRHQDAVTSHSRATGELKWVLGPHDNWGPEWQSFLLTPVGGAFEWQYHQHAPMYTPSGTLLLFDNGNGRASPFDGTEPLTGDMNYTRAVEYEIDEDAMTIRQVWEYGGGTTSERLYSGAMGDADWMIETGNVLMVLSMAEFIDGVPGADLGFGERHLRVIEVNHSTPAEKVFEVAVYNPNPESRISSYRGERIPSLYPSPDRDSDGIRDGADNCLNFPNPRQRDTNYDGIGNFCDSDLNNDCKIDFVDARIMKNSVLNGNTDADLNGDGEVGLQDFWGLKAKLFRSPGPSGVSNDCDG